MNIIKGKFRFLTAIVALAMLMTSFMPFSAIASSGGTDVSFSASAVCTDMSTYNGANEIWLLFAQATNEADIINLLSLDGSNSLGSSTGTWFTDSIYKISLNSASIADGASITLSNDDTLKTLVGNEIINDYTSVISGSFNGIGSPKAVAAIATDEDGTANTIGDKIYVFFDVITNKVPGAIETFTGGNLDGATGTWVNKQNLVITLGSTNISITDTIDLSSLGIKDFSGSINSTSLSSIALTGSFGTPIKPAVVKAVAVSKTGNSTASQGDQIVIMFNTVVTHTDINVSVARGSLGTDFNNDDKDSSGNNQFIKWQDSGMTTLTITLGSNPNVEINRTEISLTGTIKDAYSKTKTCENANSILVADGSFGIKIVPELISATIVKVADKPTATQGDKIVLAFSAPTNKATNIEAYFGGVFGSGATGIWNESGTVYTVTLGTNPALVDSATITLQASSGLKDKYGIADVPSASQTIQGSFGVANKPELLSATAIKRTTTAKAQQNDEIVLVFSAMTNKADILNKVLANETAAFGSGASGEWDTATGTIYTIKLGNGATVADNNSIKLDNSSATLKDKYELVNVDTKTVTLKGTFGTEEIETPQIVSALGYSAGMSDYIKITFNMATNLDTLAIDDDFKTIIKNNNYDSSLGTYKLGNAIPEITRTSTTLTIKLDESATIKSGDVIDLSGLGIKSKSSGTDLAVTTIACGGYLVPLVSDVVAGTGTITVSFTTRTNMPLIDLSNLFALYGENATASWVNSKTLKITLGSNYGINERGYITLDNLGIADAYAGAYTLSGQYQIQSGSFTGDALSVRDIIASSITSDSVIASAGDIITITFSHATNKPSTFGDIVNKVEKDGAEITNPFGTGATLNWINSKTLVITLGDAPSIDRDDTIYFNTATITKPAPSSSSLSTASANVKGSFDGRDYYLIGAYSKTAVTNGDHQFKVTIEDTSRAVAAKPTVVCVAYNNSTPVAISRVSMAVSGTADLLFTFAGSYKITSAKVYVFNELFDDITSVPNVLAEMRTILAE